MSAEQEEIARLSLELRRLASIVYGLVNSRHEMGLRIERLERAVQESVEEPRRALEYRERM